MHIDQLVTLDDPGDPNFAKLGRVHSIADDRVTVKPTQPAPTGAFSEWRNSDGSRCVFGIAAVRPVSVPPPGHLERALYVPSRA